MKTVAGLCVYREAGTIRSTIDSVSRYFDKVVIFDGRFLDHPELPDDGTSDIVKDLWTRDPGKIAYILTEPLLEVDKRNLMFDYCDDGDLLMVLDGDETAVGDVPAGLAYALRRTDKKVFWLKFVTDDPAKNITGLRPRIFRVSKGMHYAQRHDWIFWPDGSMVVDYEKHPNSLTDEKFCESGYHAIVREFNLSSVGSIRPVSRSDARAKYFESLGAKGWRDAQRPRIVLGCMAYQAVKVVERSLGPLLPYVDAAVLMDGPLYNPKPDDGTTDLVRRMCAKEGKPLVVDSASGVEFEVRSKMLTHVPAGDYLLMVDADEVPEGDVSVLFETVRANPQVDVFWVKVDEDYFDTGRQIVWKVKVFRVFPGYRFYPNHWTLVDGNSRLITNWTHGLRTNWKDVDGLVLKNLGREASPEFAAHRADNYRTVWSVGDPHKEPNWELKVRALNPVRSDPMPVIVCPFDGSGDPIKNPDGTFTCQSVPPHTFVKPTVLDFSFKRAS